MTNGLRHFRNRFLDVGRHPLSLLYAATAALILAEAVPLGGLGGTRSYGLFVIMVPAVSGWIAAIGRGSRSNGLQEFFAPLSRQHPGGWPCPALPLDVLSRVGGEALAGLAALLAWQAALLAAVAAAIGRGVIPTMRSQGLVDVVMFPAVVAWLLPARGTPRGWRGIAASLIGAGAVYASISARSPLPALLVSIVLTVFLFATADAAARLGERPLRETGRRRHGMLARRPRRPLEQLWRDALVGPLESNRRVFYLAGGAALAALLLGLAGGARGVVSEGLIFMATIALGASLMMRPLGLGLANARSTGRAGERPGGLWFGGGIVLPLRREWVARAFYLHGLGAGAVCAGLSVLNAELKGLPLFGLEISGHAMIAGLPWLLMVPSFAGYLTASVMGDRRLGTLSLAALALTWLTAVFAVAFYGASARLNATIWWAVGAALAFALVGGGPPLKYLFPRRTQVRSRQP